METEKEFVDKIELYLKKYFKVEREIWSDCRNGRIDVIATDKDGFKYGIECKRNDSKRGEEIGEFIKQAIRYKDYLFNGKKIPIFIAPPLSYKYFILNEYSEVINNEVWHKDRHKENHEHHTMNGLLGALGIGELRRCDDFYIFSFSNKIIWSSKIKYNTFEAFGTHEVNYNKLINKINDNGIR